MADDKIGLPGFVAISGMIKEPKLLSRGKII